MFFSRLIEATGIAALLLIAAFLHYSLPSRDVVRIVGTEASSYFFVCSRNHTILHKAITFLASISKAHSK